MNIIFSQESGNNIFRYKLPAFFVSRGIDPQDPEDTVVVTKTAPVPLVPCEHEPKQVPGLTSACAEEQEAGPRVYNNSKMPNPKIAVAKTGNDETHPLEGEEPPSPSPLKMPSTDSPGEKPVRGANDFTDFFNQFNSFMNKFAQSRSMATAADTEMPTVVPAPRKRKSDVDDELPKSRSRLSKKSNIKTVSRK